MSKLVTVSGIIIMASTVQSKATKLFCRCTNCQDVQEIVVKAGLAGAQEATAKLIKLFLGLLYPVLEVVLLHFLHQISPREESVRSAS